MSTEKELGCTCIKTGYGIWANLGGYARCPVHDPNYEKFDYPVQPTEIKRDWKERFEQWKIFRTDSFVVDLIAQRESLQKELQEYKDLLASANEVGQHLIEENAELKQKVNNLIMDDMTREYQEAEAENFRPHFEEQLIEENLELKKQALFSPIEDERIFQERQMKDIFPDYPDSAFKHQYLTGLIMLAKQSQKLEKENAELKRQLSDISPF